MEVGAIPSCFKSVRNRFILGTPFPSGPNQILLSWSLSKNAFLERLQQRPAGASITRPEGAVIGLFYVAMTRTKNRVYIAAPKTKPSRFLVELIKDFNIPHDDELNMQVVDLFNLRCPVCGFPLKYEFNKNYGLNLWICTNEAELCDFMTNDRTHMHDILKCPKCTDGYLIVKKNPKNGDIFYGCTNYFNEERKCTYMMPLESGSTNDQ